MRGRGGGGGRERAPYLIDGSLKDLTFVGLARAHVRGGNQFSQFIDVQILLGPSSFFVKALVPANNRNAGLAYLRAQDAIRFAAGIAR